MLFSIYICSGTPAERYASYAHVPLKATENEEKDSIVCSTEPIIIIIKKQTCTGGVSFVVLTNL